MLWGWPVDRPLPSVHAETEADLAALVALAGLPNLSPKRFWSLVALGRPSKTWSRVVAGRAPRTGRTRDAAEVWASWSARVDLGQLLHAHRQAGVQILPYGTATYPTVLLDDPEPPVLVFCLGPIELADRVRVGIVGTRRCTRYGRDIAHELGAALAHRSVDVVSGLAHGIDAAAHAGAQTSDRGRVVAVVAGGVDVIFPRGNAALWRSVAASGVLVSEWPLGARPERWRFPARNRLIAALSAAVVVVESPEKGGSMYTVDEALRRDRAVFSVPGSIRSPVSAGTNRLIADGAIPLCNFDELLDAVAPQPATVSIRRKPATDSWLLDLIGWEPMALDAIVTASGRPPADVTLEVEQLIAAGQVIRRLGSVVERLP